MKIDVIQTNSEIKNTFEIKYDNILKYYAQLPFISIKDPFTIEKVRKIQILDLNNNPVYISNYDFIENLKESAIPMKYLATKSQKFNQLSFNSSSNTIKIYYEVNDIWVNRYVIDINGKKYFVYSIEDGYLRHFPIYDEDKQVGEILKSNVVVDKKDEYCCYLKNQDETVADGIVSLILFLDRNEYSSSYLVVRSYDLHKSYSYNKTNKYYDKNWIINNFGDEYYKKVEADVKMAREKIKHPLKTTKEQINTLNTKEKTILKLALIGPWILIGIGLIIGLLLFIIINSFS